MHIVQQYRKVMKKGMIEYLGINSWFLSIFQKKTQKLKYLFHTLSYVR